MDFNPRQKKFVVQPWWDTFWVGCMAGMGLFIGPLFMMYYTYGNLRIWVSDSMRMLCVW